MIYSSLITWAMAYVQGNIIQENNFILLIDSHNKSQTPVFKIKHLLRPSGKRKAKPKGEGHMGRNMAKIQYRL